MFQSRGNKITWLGHATFRITTPTESNPRRPVDSIQIPTS